jgi:hypothetical protein
MFRVQRRTGVRPGILPAKPRCLYGSSLKVERGRKEAEREGNRVNKGRMTDYEKRRAKK